MKYFLCAMLLICGVPLHAQKNASVSFEQWISLKGVGSPQVSPDGKTIVYTVGTTDWTNNSYDSEIWMVRNGEPAVQLTRTAKGSSMAARFTPDSKYVSFLADRGEKTQLYIIPVSGGEAFQVTKDEEGIGSYEWNHDGTQIAYTRQELESKLEKTTKERFGAFAIDGEEYRLSHIWVLNFNLDSVLLAGQLPCYNSRPDSASKDSAKARLHDCFKLPVAKKLTEGNFTVNGFAWSPDGKKILFNRQRNPMILSGSTSDILLIDVSTKQMDTLVKNPTGDFFSRWNADGTAFTYSSAVNDSVSNYYKNNRLFIYELTTKASREVATEIDENKFVVDWNRHGLYVTALEKTKQKLYSVDPKTGKVKAVTMPYDLIGTVAFSRNTDRIVVSARNYSGLNEIYEGSLTYSLILSFTY